MCTNANAFPRDAWWVLPAASEAQYIPSDRDNRTCVNLIGDDTDQCLACCWLEQEAFGALAAQHLHERGYRRLATVQLKARERIDRRLTGFREPPKNSSSIIITCQPANSMKTDSIVD